MKKIFLKTRGKHYSGGGAMTQNGYGVAWRLPWRGISSIWGMERCCGVGMVGEKSTLVGSVILSPLSVAKSINVYCERGCEEGLIQKSQVKVVKGDFSHISLKGYIIILKSKV